MAVAPLGDVRLSLKRLPAATFVGDYADDHRRMWALAPTTTYETKIMSVAPLGGSDRQIIGWAPGVWAFRVIRRGARVDKVVSGY